MILQKKSADSFSCSRFFHVNFFVFSYFFLNFPAPVTNSNKTLPAITPNTRFASMGATTLRIPDNGNDVMASSR